MVLRRAGAVIFLIFISPLAWAQLDKDSEGALNQTVELLNDPGKRERAISGSGSPAAYEADLRARALSKNPENLKELYSISGDIFADMVRGNQGDTEKIKNGLQKGTIDPRTFYDSLSPEQKRRIKELAEDIERASKTPNPRD